MLSQSLRISWAVNVPSIKFDLPAVPNNGPIRCPRKTRRKKELWSNFITGYLCFYLFFSKNNASKAVLYMTIAIHSSLSQECQVPYISRLSGYITNGSVEETTTLTAIPNTSPSHIDCIMTFLACSF